MSFSRSMEEKTIKVDLVRFYELVYYKIKLF